MRMNSRLKNLASSVVMISFLFQISVPVAYADGVSSVFDNYTKASEGDKTTLDHLIAICSDKSKVQLESRGDGYQDVVFYTKAKDGDADSSIQKINCAAVGIGPLLVKSSDVRHTSTCDVANVEGQFKSQVQALQDLQYNAQIKRCETTGTKILSAQCAKELGCNIARSFATVSRAMGADLISSALGQAAAKPAPGSCMDTSQSDCLTKVVGTILKALWSMVSDVPKALYHAGKDLYAWASSKFSKQTEQDATTKMVIGSRTSDSQWTQFKNDPPGYLKDTLMGIMNTMVDKLTSTGKSIKLSWKCATCNGMMNGICSLVGELGTPLVIAAVTGTIAGYVAKIATSATEVTRVGKIFQEMSEIAEKLEKSKVVEAVTKTIKTVSKKIEFITDPIGPALNKIPLYRQYVALPEKVFARTYLRDAEAYNVWRDEKEMSDAIKAVEKTNGFGRKLTNEEKSLVSDNLELFKSKTSASDIEKALTELKNAPPSLDGMVANLKTLDVSNAAMAEKQAEAAAEHELESSAALIDTGGLTGAQVDAVRASALDRAKQILSAVKNNSSMSLEERLARINADYQAIQSGSHVSHKVEKYAKKASELVGGAKDIPEDVSGDDQ